MYIHVHVCLGGSCSWLQFVLNMIGCPLSLHSHQMLQSFERLMTFYTPDLPSGLPGSFPSVQMVPPDHVPGEVEEPLSLHLIIINFVCSVGLTVRAV